jgi:cell division protein FtsB
VTNLPGDSQTHSREGIWHSLNRFLLTLIVLSAIIPIGYAFLPEVKKRKEAEARNEELRLDIEDTRMQLAHFELEEKLLKTDPEYVGIFARDLLGLMDKGETIYRLDPPKAGAAKPAARR